MAQTTGGSKSGGRSGPPPRPRPIEFLASVLRTYARMLFAVGTLYCGLAVGYYLVGFSNIWQINRAAKNPVHGRIVAIYASHPWYNPPEWKRLPANLAAKLAAALAAPRRVSRSYYEPSPSMFLKLCLADGAVRFAAVWPRPGRDQLVMAYYSERSRGWESVRGVRCAPLPPLTPRERKWVSGYTTYSRSPRRMRRGRGGG
jgi:hypothetical protein